MRYLSDLRLFAIYFNAGEVFGETFLEPGIECLLKVGIHKLVSILVKDYGPGILGRHVEHNEISVASSLKQAGNLRRLAVKHGGNLAHLLGIAECHYLQGEGPAAV